MVICLATAKNSSYLLRKSPKIEVLFDLCPLEQRTGDILFFCKICGQIILKLLIILRFVEMDYPKPVATLH